MELSSFRVGLHVAALLAAVLQMTDAQAAEPGSPGRAPLYHEALRPQFHFTARYWNDYRLHPPNHHEGWMNDINGLVYHEGEYHFFAQRWWSAWLHAVSTDLIHWEELPPAFGKGGKFGGTQSGGGVVDHRNRSGLGDGKTPPIIAFWSSTDNLNQCISYSRDKGRTWTKYEKNPVLVHPFRDPKVFWHEPTQRWITILYGPSDDTAAPPRYGFNGESNDAHDLQEWKPGEWNSSVVRLFPDGRVAVADQANRSVGQINIERQNLGAGSFQVGAKADGSEFLNGEIASVMVYDRPLSDEETSTLVGSLKDGHNSAFPKEGLVLHLEASRATAGAEGKVAHWQDLSAKAHDVKQSDPEMRPMLVLPKDSADRAAVQFSGAQTLRGSAVLAEGDDSFTIAALWRRRQLGGSEVICEQNSTTKTAGRRGALLAAGEGVRQNCYFLFSSTNLLEWTKLPGSIPNSFECPDMFELPIQGAGGDSKWVIIDGNGDYIIGAFDGTKFTPETEKRKGDYGRNFYATMTFENMPASDPRRIQIAWMRGWDDYPKNMPFNQQASFPCELTLHKLPTGLTLCRTPIREIATLHDGAGFVSRDQVLKPGSNPLAEIIGEFFDIRVVLDVSRSTCDELTLHARGSEVRYDLRRGILHSHGSEAPLAPQAGEIEIRVLVDRLSIETFGNQGTVSITNVALQNQASPHLGLTASRGDAVLKSVEVHPLRSIWKQPREVRR
ncbi:MAG: sacC [Chthoniobacter sp.]|nr:sacC [Chthoniobacter sp.]